MEDAELRAHYSRGEERSRLSAGRGLLEFTRTTRLVLRLLPAATALVADIGVGPGRYALWLAGYGYQVKHRDLMPLHVRQLSEDADGVAGMRTAVGDARELDLADASVDAVLLLGPLYHLRRAPSGGSCPVCSTSTTWSASKDRPTCWPTWPNGWRIRPRGPSSWRSPAPSSGVPELLGLGLHLLATGSRPGTPEAQGSQDPGNGTAHRHGRI